MNLDLDHGAIRTFLVVGDYGSGKSEIAVNLALRLALRFPVAIADLDLVNPYFRCREAHAPLEAAQIRVVVPVGGQAFADLPILLPEVKGLLQDSRTIAILDVGGDEVGARVLASLQPFAATERTAFWFVINASRPFNDTVDGCLRAIERIERASRLQVTGLIANTHLMSETTPEMVLAGIALAEQVAAARGAPVALVAAMEGVASRLPSIPYPLLPLRRLLVPPWVRPDSPRLGPAGLRSS